MTVIIFQRMEVHLYPEKWMVHYFIHLAQNMMCIIHFFFLRKIITVVPYHLIFNTLKIPKITFDVNVANSIAIEVVNGVHFFCTSRLVD